jgi:cobalt-zinc-cadmium efflux system membrane fusion protein
MKNKSWLVNLIVLAFIVIAAIGFAYFLKPSLFNEVSTQQKSEHEETSAQDFKRGPHRGRMLQTDGFQAEVTIFEPEGIPPKFRIYFYDHGTPVKPSEVKYQMELTRINRVENVPFQEQADYLESTIEATEPHSFKVSIHATYKDKTYQWEYESYEGRVELTSEAINANAIKT